jgi:hypothetical protein
VESREMFLGTQKRKISGRHENVRESKQSTLCKLLFSHTWQNIEY